jgi:hypothetical protein
MAWRGRNFCFRVTQIGPSSGTVSFPSETSLTRFLHSTAITLVAFLQAPTHAYEGDRRDVSCKLVLAG